MFEQLRQRSRQEFGCFRARFRAQHVSWPYINVSTLDYAQLTRQTHFRSTQDAKIRVEGAMIT